MKREVSLNQVHRLVAARPTCLLTVRYKGKLNVMALAWVCPVSLEPPLLMMAIHPSCYTHDMLKRSEECVLNIPGRALADQVWKCGNNSGRDVDKVQLTRLGLDSGHRVEVPSIAEALAYLECAVIDIMTPGDHTVFVAEVLGAWAEAEAFDGVWLAPQDNEELHPMLHLGGREFCLLGKRITVANT